MEEVEGRGGSGSFGVLCEDRRRSVASWRFGACESHAHGVAGK